MYYNKLIQQFPAFTTKIKKMYLTLLNRFQINKDILNLL